MPSHTRLSAAHSSLHVSVPLLDSPPDDEPPALDERAPDELVLLADCEALVETPEEPGCEVELDDDTTLLPDELDDDSGGLPVWVHPMATDKPAKTTNTRTEMRCMTFSK